MKWQVVSFDENEKLYIVRGATGTCRATRNRVVYGVTGTCLKSTPKYESAVLEAIEFYIQFQGEDINTSEFGKQLLMAAMNNTNVPFKNVVQFIQDNPSIVDCLESLAKVYQKTFDDFITNTRRFILRYFNIILRNEVDNPEDETGKILEYLRSVIYFLNLDKKWYRMFNEWAIAQSYENVINMARTFKRIQGITPHEVDEQIMNNRKEIAFRFMANYQEFAICLVAKPYLDDMIEVFGYYNARDAVVSYVEQCQMMNIEPYFKGNILTLLANTNRIYEQQKDELKKKALKEVVKRFEWLNEFSHNGLGVVVLATPEDFVNEGEKQHNCVYRFGYLDKMINGSCIICGVRPLDNINEPYITCEVSVKDGKPAHIAQFLKKFNSRSMSVQEYDFEAAFEEFITNHR